MSANVTLKVMEHITIMYQYTEELYYLQINTANISTIASTFTSNSVQHGVIYSYGCSITITTTRFFDNSINFDGVLLTSFSSNITIEQSNFEDNIGIALFSDSSIIKINPSEFLNNTILRHHDREILVLYTSNATIEQSTFVDNYIGSTLFCYNSTVRILMSNFFRVTLISYSTNTTVQQSAFENNVIDNNDPSRLNSVFTSQESNVLIRECRFSDNFGIILTFTDNRNSTIDKSEFRHNTGSVVLSSDSTVTIIASVFDNNTEAGYFLLDQGIVLGSSGDTIVICNSNFTNNNSPVIVAFGSIIGHTKSLLVVNNSVENGFATIHLDNSEFIGHHSANATISNNLRSLVAFTSNVTFMGNVKYSNNWQSTTTTDLQEGGAMTLVQSNAYLDGTCKFEYNYAENGGAIFSIDSKLYVHGNVTVAHNVAKRNGGGIYLTESALECLNGSTFVLVNNTAQYKGGGLHAISSFIKAISVLQATQVDTAILKFTKNIAERGGGLSLEANAKIYILKYEYGDIVFGNNVMYERSYTMIFTANRADYGGAVYVDDDTNSGTCASDPKTECFFQVLAYIYGLYGLRSIPESTLNHTKNNLKPQSLYFSGNNANVSGFILYGGLLDRCAVNQFAEVRIKYAEDYENRGNSIQYLTHVSTITESDTSISSRPVRVCLCIDNEHNCTHQRHIKVKKGESFNVSLASINQINQPVSGLIHASLHFARSVVASGQATREIPAKCTNLTFNAVSPHSSEQLTLYALDGPCRDVNLSMISLDISFLPCSCPVGLQIVGINGTSCTCECHRNINQYVEECNRYTGAFIRKYQSNAWIAFIDNTELSGYLLYSNCPFDYCNTFNITINLNHPDGADAQCAFNRSFLLCGSCQTNLSLSLGSSHCLQCPSYWPALFISITIAAVLAGIALVALLLVLNMTVAVGTLNGLIFYANVVYANKSILFPFQDTNFVTVFLSWLNLELGIDACYFPGTNTFWKTWLQLAFPAYIILLVALVIIISSYSSRFSNLIGRKNPVATLATLILLSYAKLLEVCFKSLSSGNLSYPDGSTEMVWLPDATIKYLSGKHIILFLAVLLILLVGLVYTVLLFSWQWLLHLPRWRIFRWSRDQKLQIFIETYHTPYTPKHRYWTGLLLLARAVLYLVAAVNVSNDPTVALTTIIVIICCILVLKGFIGSRVYQNWLVDILETLFHLNTLLFTTFTWYCLDGCRNKKAPAYTSVVITFFVLLLIILYHIYTYTTVLSKINEPKAVNTLKRLITPVAKDQMEEGNLPPDADAHGLHVLLDTIDRPINTNDYKIPVKQVEPTCSVVEVHQPSHPEEANVKKHTSS